MSDQAVIDAAVEWYDAHQQMDEQLDDDTIASGVLIARSITRWTAATNTLRSVVEAYQREQEGTPA